MQMINEVTIMQQNKNIFNKILSMLNKKVKSLKLRNTYNVYERMFTDELSNDIYVSFKIKIKKIITVVEKGYVFFCASLEPKISEISYYGVPVQEDDIIEKDPALYLINHWLRNWKSKYEAGDRVWNTLESEGITPGVDEYEIKKKNFYFSLNRRIDQIRDNVKVKFILHEGIQKKLTTVRENIIPLLFYEVKNDLFNYPRFRLNGKSANSTSVRSYEYSTTILRGKNMEEMCNYAVYNTPYRQWLRVEKVR